MGLSHARSGKRCNDFKVGGELSCRGQKATFEPRGGGSGVRTLRSDPGPETSRAKQTTSSGSATEMASHGEPSLALANSTLRSWSDRPALPDPATESGMWPDLSRAHSARNGEVGLKSRRSIRYLRKEETSTHRVPSPSSS
uniref:OSJNBa0036E02.15 protein n=1 Tax=Oryza sativa subsp. japonica TaxID=39947 RepID=Q7F7F8_ORYSJ|nr:unnamed protein product [Oryza sativa Japonica Group]BAB17741.1 OSJNBa0036E02.15 [Oryza sativa Japonica Group]